MLNLALHVFMEPMTKPKVKEALLVSNIGWIGLGLLIGIFILGMAEKLYFHFVRCPLEERIKE